MRFPFCFLILISTLLCTSLSAQAQGGHTVFFYPLYSNLPIKDYNTIDLEKINPSKNNSFARKSLNPSFGIGYNFLFRKKWAFETKFFVQQDAKPTSSIEYLGVSKHLKLGLKHFFVNRKFQWSLGTYYYLSGREKTSNRIFLDDSFINQTLKENEMGFELGIGCAYRITDQAKVFLGSAIRLSRVALKRDFVAYINTELFLFPFESLGFGYTF